MDLTKLSADTDLCVKCGLCLPHCPTYTETLDENESPRGRIALIQGWAAGGLEASPGLVRHVDNCLLCRSCEVVCPAYVPYGSIVDRFRGAVASRGKTRAARFKSGLLRRVLTGRVVSRWPRAILQKPAGRGLRSLLRSSGIFRLLGLSDVEAGLPPFPAAPPDLATRRTSASGSPQGALFLGCTAELLDGEALSSALWTADRLGIALSIPEQQGCCGALHRHAGDEAGAAELARRNLAAFGAESGPPVVAFASGCAGMLREYGDATGDAAAAKFSARVRDLSRFFAEQTWPAEAKPAPLNAKVCLHTPCSLRNQLRSERFPADLLKRIPGLKLAVLPPAPRCCGAAGSYLLEHPQMARTLRDQVLDRVLRENPAYVATSNPGCASHLRAGLKKVGRGDIEVLHPVTLLARQFGKPAA